MRSSIKRVVRSLACSIRRMSRIGNPVGDVRIPREKSTGMTDPPQIVCPVCGGRSFSRKKVISDELAHEWALSPAERDLVDDQQGLACAGCACNLRSMTLALGIIRATHFTGLFTEFCASDAAKRLRILEINETGHLSRYLSQCPGRDLAAYPRFDMQSLTCPDGRYDLVVHSDTLEHVPDSRRGLEECRRVLKPSGSLVYTLPILPGRMTRSRAGLPPSHHGVGGRKAGDYIVCREYGADFWGEVFEAGFEHVEIHTLKYPFSLAIVARKG